MAEKKKIDIVTASTKLKEILRKRLFDELKLTYDQIVANSIEDGVKSLNKSNISKYFSSNKAVSGSISQKLLLYLTFRYAVSIKLVVKKEEYNEKHCKKIVKGSF